MFNINKVLSIESIKIYKLAFTLAEVLIVLGIVGIIADMTIPSLIKKTEEQVAVAKLKKVHSTMETAFRQAIVENGTPDNWDLRGVNDMVGAENFVKPVLPYLKVSKQCIGSNYRGCSPDVYYKYLNGSNWGKLNTSYNQSKIILDDGVIVSFEVASKDCSVDPDTPIVQYRNYCGALHVDINGHKPPNRLGYDLFVFRVTKNSVSPMGFPIGANKAADKPSDAGWGTAAWVVTYGNMDYKKCSNLVWDEKTKCD